MTAAELIVPAYLTVGIHALRGMDTTNCVFGCAFGFQLRIKTEGLPRAATDFLCESVSGAQERDC